MRRKVCKCTRFAPFTCPAAQMAVPGPLPTSSMRVGATLGLRVAASLSTRRTMVYAGSSRRDTYVSVSEGPNDAAVRRGAAPALPSLALRASRVLSSKCALATVLSWAGVRSLIKAARRRSITCGARNTCRHGSRAWLTSFRMSETLSILSLKSLVSYATGTES